MKLIRAVGRAALVLHDHALLLIGQCDQILRDLLEHGDRQMFGFKPTQSIGWTRTRPGRINRRGKCQLMRGVVGQTIRRDFWPNDLREELLIRVGWVQCGRGRRNCSSTQIPMCASKGACA